MGYGKCRYNSAQFIRFGENSERLFSVIYGNLSDFLKGDKAE